jgi:hypothetical protein
MPVDVFVGGQCDLRLADRVGPGGAAEGDIAWQAGIRVAGAADLRFAAMAPVSAERTAMFARTAELIGGQLVTSGATAISPLVVPELTRLAAIAFLATFPNTTMTAPYLPGQEAG